MDVMDLHWWSVEVRDGTSSARSWRDAHASALIEAAITNAAWEWHWADLAWGVVFEIAFRNDDSWQRFRRLPAIVAALDAVPDPVNGLYVYPGRGGSAGAGRPRHPGPRTGAGAAELPSTPEPVVVARLEAVVAAA